MSKVHTSYGLGEVVETQTVHGRTTHKVAGEGFEIWIDAALLQFDENPPEVNRSNTTTLPYDPRPQWPSEVYQQPLGDMRIDPDKRLRPSDSLTFEERPYAAEPAPAGHLFAEASTEETYGSRDARFAAVPEEFDKDSIISRLRHNPVRLAQDLQFAHHAGDGHEIDEHTANYLNLLAADADIRTAAWKDVRAKGVRIRNDGQVEVIGATPQSIYAYVMGDHGVYETIVVRSGAMAGDSSISEWDCTCEWGKWAFKRKFTFVGRLCSHAYAAYLELRSQHQKKDKTPAWYASRSVEADGEGRSEPVPAADAEGDMGQPQDQDPNADMQNTAGRRGYEPAPGYLTHEPGSLHFDDNDIPDAGGHLHHEDLRSEHGLIGVSSSIGIMAAIIDIQRVIDPEDQQLLERLRALGAENNRPQHNEERNREMSRIVQVLRARGYNADNLTAAIEVQACGGLYEPENHEPFQGSGAVDAPDIDTSESYVERHERSRMERVNVPGINPVMAASEDHDFREASLDSIQAFGNMDPLAGSTGSSSAPVEADDPALAMFSAVDTREAAVSDQGDPLAYLMGGVPKVAGRNYTFSEQEALINEASADGAPLDPKELSLEGTHYLL